MHLYVIAGHGDGDSGAVGNGYTEAERVRALAKKIKEYGKERVTLGDLDRNYYKDDGISRLDIPKDWCLIELHMDSGSSSARGGHVIIYRAFQPDSYDLALGTFISKMFPGRANAIVGREDLANLKRAAKKGYNYRLVEFGFLSNAEDVEIFNKNLDAIAIGVLRCFGIASDGDGKGVETIRHLSPGSAHLYSDAPIYDMEWKKVIIDGKEGDHITILDQGTSVVKVRYNNTEGMIACKYVMPDIVPGDQLELVEDVKITLKKGMQIESQDHGYLGNLVSGEFVIDSRYVQKVVK